MVFDGLEKSWVEFAIEDKIKQLKTWDIDSEDMDKAIKALESALNKVKENI